MVLARTAEMPSAFYRQPLDAMAELVVRGVRVGAATGGGINLNDGSLQILGAELSENTGTGGDGGLAGHGGNGCAAGSALDGIYYTAVSYGFSYGYAYVAMPGPVGGSGGPGGNGGAGGNADGAAINRITGISTLINVTGDQNTLHGGKGGDGGNGGGGAIGGNGGIADGGFGYTVLGGVYKPTSASYIPGGGSGGDGGGGGAGGNGGNGGSTSGGGIYSAGGSISLGGDYFGFHCSRQRWKCRRRRQCR